MITQTIRILFCTVFSALPLCLLADSAQDKLSAEWALVSADRVNLRIAPSLSATVIAQFPIGLWIKATNDIKNLEGRSWRRVVVVSCDGVKPRNACMVGKTTGWVAENYVVLVSRFERVTRWKEQFLTDRLDGDGQMSFHVRSDGTVDYVSHNQVQDTGVMLRKDRLVLWRFSHIYPSHPGQDALYYKLYVMDETNRLCSIDDGIGSGEIRTDTCTRSRPKPGFKGSEPFTPPGENVQPSP